MTTKAIGLLVTVSMLTACVTQTPYDYSEFRAARPRSILVLPPMNESNDVTADYNYLSTISGPIGECGFYVFPVAVVDALMKQNGMPTAAEMHAIPLHKIDEIIGADAVLYVTIEEWGQKYIVIQSMTVVRTRYRLVDVKSGNTLWQGRQDYVVGSGDGGGGIAGMLIMAVVDQIVDHYVDSAHDVARSGNYLTATNLHHGLLIGPYLKNEASDLCGEAKRRSR